MTYQIHNKNGDLSSYGLACGYQELEESREKSLSLWREGGYHVCFFDHQTSEKIWDVFEKLTDARKRFKYLEKLI